MSKLLRIILGSVVVVVAAQGQAQNVLTAPTSSQTITQPFGSTLTIVGGVTFLTNPPGGFGGGVGGSGNPNIGIGTTSPLSRLDVYVPSASYSSAGIIFRDAVTPSLAGNADDLLTVRGTGSSTTMWRGRITAGGDNKELLFGEYNGQAWLGANNAALNAWADLYINPESGITSRVFVGAHGSRTNSILTVDNGSGNVGIGTTSPVSALSVLSNATGINGESLALQRTGAGDVGLSFQQDGIDSFGIVSRSGVGSGLAFVHNYWEGSAGAEVMRLLGNGNVGIGTTTPSVPLEVNGSIKIDVGSLVFPDGSYLSSATLAPNGTSGVISTTNGGIVGAIPVYSSASGLTSSSVTEVNGNVGISNSTPIGKLDVVTANNNCPGCLVAFDNKYSLVGTGVGAGPGSGAVALSYDQTNGNGYIMAVSPGIAWRNLSLQPVMGNVGVNILTPVAPFQVGAETAIQTIGVQSAFNNNTFYDGSNWRYINSGTTAAIRMYSNNIAFHTTTTGNAGDAVTDMDTSGPKMVLFNSGGLAIGNSLVAINNQTDPGAGNLAVSGTVTAGQGVVFPSGGTQTVAYPGPPTLSSILGVAPIPTSDLPSDVAYTDQPQVFTAQNSFMTGTGFGTSFPGTWSGISGIGGTNVQLFNNGNARLIINSNSNDGAELHLVDGAAQPDHRNHRFYVDNGGLVLDQPSDNYASSTPNMFWGNNGYVGVGTTAPTATLEVNGSAKIDGAWVNVGPAAGGLYGDSTNTVIQAPVSGNVYLANFGIDGTRVSETDGTLRIGGPAQPTARLVFPDGTSQITAATGGGGGSLPADLVYTDHATQQVISGPTAFTDSVGIGTTSPSAKLEVNAGSANSMTTGLMITGGDGGIAAGTSLLLKSAYGSSNWLMARVGAVTSGYGISYGSDLLFQTNGDANGSDPANLIERMRVTSTGNVGIGTSAPGAPLEVDGNIKLTHLSGASITFQDGSVQNVAWNGILAGGDYAEAVDVLGDRASYEAGDVIIIDTASPGKFAKSDKSYSRLVAGVFSTKPGLVGRRATADRPNKADEVPMAMMGIVPTKVTTENGAIEPGDLLVSSSQPGYAMKATDSSRMQGAMIGKALSSLSNGQGVIEVLISLQ